jgi:hypothetical protein
MELLPPPSQEQVWAIGKQEENGRITQSLYRATGRNARLFKGPVPNEDIVIAPEAWATLMTEISGVLFSVEDN